jgi:2-alkenal reductase
MRLAILVLLVLLGLMVAQPYVEMALFRTDQPRPVAPRADLTEAEKSSVALFERLAPSVVLVINLPRRSGYMDPAGSGGGSGTGFVWDAVGHIVTNDHVVENAGSIAVRFASGETVEARLVGKSPAHDLAVLRLAAAAPMPPPVPIGQASDLKVGQAVYAIGNPFGLDQTLTTGIVSALRRRLPTSGGREIADVIQTDAAINPGNSGGPLLDSAGRLIGVNTAIFSPSGANAGIGFAIPVDTVNRIVPALIRDGRVPVPGVGIAVADEEATSRLGLEGVVIARTLQGSPAAAAGLRGIDMRTGQIGDVIVEANGKPVRRLADLTEQLEVVGIGKTIALKVRRGSGTAALDVAVVDVGPR